MKIAILLFSLVAVAIAGPVNISDNNVGDIVAVKVNANLDISNDIDINLISVLVTLLSQEGTVNVPDAPNLRLTPEMLEKVKEHSLLTPEMVERMREFIRSA